MHQVSFIIYLWILRNTGLSTSLHFCGPPIYVLNHSFVALFLSCYLIMLKWCFTHNHGNTFHIYKLYICKFAYEDFTYVNPIFISVALKTNDVCMGPSFTTIIYIYVNVTHPQHLCRNTFLYTHLCSGCENDVCIGPSFTTKVLETSIPHTQALVHLTLRPSFTTIILENQLWSGFFCGIPAKWVEDALSTVAPPMMTAFKSALLPHENHMYQRELETTSTQLIWEVRFPLNTFCTTAYWVLSAVYWARRCHCTMNVLYFNTQQHLLQHLLVMVI